MTHFRGPSMGYHPVRGSGIPRSRGPGSGSWAMGRTPKMTLFGVTFGRGPETFIRAYGLKTDKRWLKRGS